MSSLTLDIRPPLARLTLARDLLGAAEVRDLASACESLASEEAVSALVLTGAGAAFSRGWDWAGLAGEAGDAEEALRLAGLLDDPFGCLAALPKPVVCAVNGEASGGGLALALAADIRIAAESATFALPETALGLVPAAGATQRLVRLVGRGAALSLALGGEPIGAAEALRLGLVSEVVPDGDAVRRADEIAARIAEHGPLAVRYAKEVISRGVEMPLEQGLRYETDLTILLQTTEDRAEGVRAFLEKRKPEFKGR
jgi:enoyl-CoA hydratase